MRSRPRRWRPLGRSSGRVQAGLRRGDPACHWSMAIAEVVANDHDSPRTLIADLACRLDRCRRRAHIGWFGMSDGVLHHHVQCADGGPGRGVRRLRADGPVTRGCSRASGSARGSTGVRAAPRLSSMHPVQATSAGERAGASQHVTAGRRHQPARSPTCRTGEGTRSALRYAAYADRAD